MDRLRVYDGERDMTWKVVDLHWQGADVPVRFVIAHDAEGGRIIFLSTSLSLTGPEIINAYSWRFKIEVNFRTLHQALSGFDYHFWLKPLERAERWSKNLDLTECSDLLRGKILAKVAAYERFVNLAGIALGLLQILAIEQPALVYRLFPAWFRTLPGHRLPSEQVVHITQQHHAPRFFDGSAPDLLLAKFLARLRQQDPATEARAA